jgi:two-component system NarL family sensor kinase
LKEFGHAAVQPALIPRRTRKRGQIERSDSRLGLQEPCSTQRQGDELVAMTAAGRHLQLQPSVPTGGPVEPRTDPVVEGLRRRLVRMAFDVHDGPMQELIALSYGLHELRKKVSSSSDRADSLSGEFEQLGERLVETEQMLRGMMRSLEQTAAGQTDLVAMVEEQVATFRQRCPEIDVGVSAEGEIELHTDSQRIAVDRVLREALTNVAKHAGADKVTVRLQGLPGVLLLSVQDDGRGFDPGARGESTARVGLRSMQRRLELLGGKLTIDSRPGGPTTITAAIQKWQPATEAPVGPVALQDTA